MIRVGIVGTSQWAQRMYIAALKTHPQGMVTAICSRDADHVKACAEQWKIPYTFTDWRDLLDSDTIDAVIIASPNHTHYPITMHALKNSVPVLCEKPLALNYAQADAMATEAERRDLLTMTALTYTFFPQYRYMAHLIQSGEIGTPYHMNMRFYSSFGLDGRAQWRFDARQSGGGALADLAPHVISVARLLLGEISAVSGRLDTFVVREGIAAAHRSNDHALFWARWATGAVGSFEISTVSHQPQREGHRQVVEVSGSAGTLYFYNDFSSQFSLRLGRTGEESAYEIAVPAAWWNPRISRETPRAMYADLFERSDAMAREFVSALATGRAIKGPDLREGAEVQKVQDAVMASHAEDGVWVDVG